MAVISILELLYEIEFFGLVAPAVAVVADVDVVAAVAAVGVIVVVVALEVAAFAVVVIIAVVIQLLKGLPESHVLCHLLFLERHLFLRYPHSIPYLL